MRVTKSIYYDLLEIFEQEALQEKNVPIFPWYPIDLTLGHYRNYYKRRTYKMRIKLHCEQCKNQWTSAHGTFEIIFWLYKRPRSRPNVIYNARIYGQSCKYCQNSARIDPDEDDIQKSLIAFYYFLQKIYHDKTFKPRRPTGSGLHYKTNDKHYSEYCEACHEGVCSYLPQSPSKDVYINSETYTETRKDQYRSDDRNDRNNDRRDNNNRNYSSNDDDNNGYDDQSSSNSMYNRPKDIQQLFNSRPQTQQTPSNQQTQPQSKKNKNPSKQDSQSSSQNDEKKQSQTEKKQSQTEKKSQKTTLENEEERLEEKHKAKHAPPKTQQQEELKIEESKSESQKLRIIPNKEETKSSQLTKSKVEHKSLNQVSQRDSEEEKYDAQEPHHAPLTTSSLKEFDKQHPSTNILFTFPVDLDSLSCSQASEAEPLSNHQDHLRQFLNSIRKEQRPRESQKRTEESQIINEMFKQEVRDLHFKNRVSNEDNLESEYNERLRRGQYKQTHYGQRRQ